MFKWPGLPSPRAPAHEVADFAELVCCAFVPVRMFFVAEALSRVNTAAMRVAVRSVPHRRFLR